MEHHNTGMTVPQRIHVLEEALANARREISVASLAFLVMITNGEPAQYVAVKTRLLALGRVVEGALEELERLQEEEDAEESR